MAELTYAPIPVKFEEPRDFDNKPLTAVTLRPPSTADVVNAQRVYGDTIQKDVLLYANLSGTTEDFINSLAFYDFKQVEAAFECFLFPLSVYADKRALFLREALVEPALES